MATKKMTGWRNLTIWKLLNQALACGDYRQRVIDATTELDLKCQLHAGGVSNGGRGGKSAGEAESK